MMDDLHMNDLPYDRTLEGGLARIFDYVPHILGALLLLVAGYFIAKLLDSAVRRALQRARFDRALHASPAGNYVARIMESPSRFAGRLTFWLVFLAFISFAVSALDLPVLNQIINGVYAYLPNVIAAVVIFLAASAVAAGTAAFANRLMGDTPSARLVAAIVPGVVMSIAIFMILNQLRIAPAIVTITYTAIIGAVALASALAFGLGGRDVARQILEQAYEAGRRNAGTAKRDARVAKDRLDEQGEKIRRQSRQG